jgi:GDP-D-mannose 3', 5'-epimerase
MSKLTLVTGAGGFIGGQLVRDLLAKGVPVRAVDKKQLGEWFFPTSEAENVVANLQLAEACDMVTRGVAHVYNLAADMGGMSFIEHNKALCMLSVLINTHMLMSAQKHGIWSSSCDVPFTPGPKSPRNEMEE